jgi:F-type H+-transporting ATPase subunit epsilon
MAEITCIVVTPEETALSQETDFVVVPLFDGELGIGPAHSPMIGRLGYGELRLGRDGNDRFYVDGGFVQVEGNVVSVLTNSLRRPSDLDTAAAAQSLDDAKSLPVATDEQLAVRDQKVDRARAQIKIGS